jgi:hypothetical protein
MPLRTVIHRQNIASSTTAPSTPTQRVAPSHLRTSIAQISTSPSITQVEPQLQYRYSSKFRMLTAYLHHFRRTWLLPSAKTRRAVIDRIVRARHVEGFWCVYSNAYENNFALEVASPVQQRGSPSIPYLIQYLVYQSAANCLTTEFWMQPQFSYVRCCYYLPNTHTHTLSLYLSLTNCDHLISM